LIAAVRSELDAHHISLPIYWGNRNWHPLLADTLRQMAADGIRRALAVVLAAYSSYSSCRQYRENIEDARQAAGPDGPEVDKVRVFYNHPDFISVSADRVRAALDDIPAERRGEARIAFTAHSIPSSMARNCDYERQLTETCRLVADAVGVGPERWQLVYQSRSGRPQDPWLEPDVSDRLRDVAASGVRDVTLVPIGFVCDHVEVLYDLDVEARGTATALGLRLRRAATVGEHPRFIELLAELAREAGG
jgi:ferrochelatase